MSGPFGATPWMYDESAFYPLTIDQSLKFNDDESQYLSWTPAAAGNRKTWTWSGWVKRSKLGATQGIFASDGTSDTTLFEMFFSGGDQLGAQGSSSTFFRTTQLFRDTSAWYHIVLKWDAANTNADLYVNGVEVTSWSTAPSPSNQDYGINNNVEHYIGSRDGGANPFDGYLSDIHFIDGQALAPTNFGEFKDSIWIPKVYNGTYGTNGFHLPFKNDDTVEGFNAVTYRGNDSANSISGIGFSPDFVWIKQRNAAENHFLTDSVRGAGLHLRSDATTAESDSSATFTSFDADGFSLTGTGSAAPQVNDNNDTYVGWAWDAGGKPTADNSAGAGATPTAGSVKIDGSNLGSALAGSIAATRLSANTSKGFSIVTYTGTGSAATVAQGLGAAPKWVIVKRRNGTPSWQVFHTSLGGGKSIELDNTSAAGSTTSVWNNTAPTSSVINIGTHGGTNTSSGTYVAYCWTDISGYSKFGTYSGNGSSTGPTVTTGFRPAMVIAKRTDSAISWVIFDNTRDPANPVSHRLNPNSSGSEGTNVNLCNFTDTGFAITTSDGIINANGGSYIYMAFADTREAAFWRDTSGNNNDWTPNNLDYRDSLVDSTTNNFAVMNSLEASSGVSVTLSEGNLKAVGTTVNYSGGITSTFEQSSGKWYWEVLVGSKVTAGSNYYSFIGAATGENNLVHKANNSQIPSVVSGSYGWTWEGDGTINLSGTGTKAVSSVSAPSAGDILGFAIDLDNGNVYFYYNGVAQNSGNAVITGVTGLLHNPMVGVYNGSAATFNFGQDSSFAGNKATSNANADGNGHGSFAYAPPSGFLALCSQNLPDVKIIDGMEHFNTVLYTGDASTSRAISGVGFSPDWLWIKNRSNTYSHMIYDVVRGAGKYISSDNTGAEATGSHMNSFDSDGFTVSYASSNRTNQNNENYAAWNWKAGTAFSNDASATSVGTIDSTGQVNTKAGFSIVSYTGNGTNGATFKHGLSSKPQLAIIKNRDASTNWIVYTEKLGATKNLVLEETGAAVTSATRFNNTEPTSTVFSLGTTTAVNGSGTDYIAYCFHSVEGYSKVGSYTGNGSTDGTFVHTGFRPAWIMLKESGNARNWVISYDYSTYYNGVTQSLFPNITQAEDANVRLDFLSNGFKLRTTSTSWNNSGGNFIYLAFAENPVKYSNAR